ncbi:MAG: tetratricopeptide repeat protein [Rhodanobacteraceae bacterium]
MGNRGFWRELKRRHVYRVAAAYAVVGWLLIQISTQVFPFFHIPDWSVRLLVLLVLAGFPVAMVLAWAFDATPQGIVRTEPEGQPVLRRSNHGTLTIGILGVVIAAVIGAGYWWWHRQPSAAHPQALAAGSVSRAPAAGPGATTAVPDLSLPMTMAGPVAIEPKSIAVLPFENMSSDAGNKYFADGMQDMILTKLADIGDLKVISRTSTEKYQSHPDNLKTIGRQLAVANILEGSVQKAGDQVLINVQLIDARTDSHLWAQAYTRKLDNIFGVEGEVAQQIAQALHATLSQREQQKLAVKSTQNAQAYDAYLRGLAAGLNAQSTADQYRQAAGFFSDAVARDPGFALAWARLAEVDSRIYQLRYNRSTTLAADAKHAADTALKLAPDSGEAWLARAIYLYKVEADYQNAVAALTQAQQRLPNNGEVLAAFADVETRQGQWNAAIEHIDRASVTDPRNTRLLLLHSQIHAMRREFPDALAILRHALAIAPDDAALLACKASVLQAQGQLDQAQALLAPLPPAPGDPTVFKTQVMQWLYRHDYARAIRVLQDAMAQPQTSLGSDLGDYYYLLAFALQSSGDAAGAHAAYLTAQGKLEEMLKVSPDELGLTADLGLVFAGLGDKAQALALAEKAMKLEPAVLDATTGPAWQEQRARIEAQTGEKDRAIADLALLLQTPYASAFYGTAITSALLRQDPAWSSLHGDPRFAKLADGKTASHE